MMSLVNGHAIEKSICTSLYISAKFDIE